MIYFLVVLMYFMLYFKGRDLVAYLCESDLKTLCQILDKDIRVIKKKRYHYLYLVPPLILVPNIFKCILGMGVLYLYLREYRSLKVEFIKLKNQIHYEFPMWMRSIQCHLQNSTVVSAIQSSHKTAPTLIQYHLEDLIWKLSYKPDDLQTFEGFMSEYENVDIRKMMKVLYRYTVMSKDEGSKHLDRMIQSTSQWMAHSRTLKQTEKLDVYSILGIIPVFVVSVFFILMMGLMMLVMFEGGWMV